MSPKVAVSYSWKEEREGEHVELVDAFCDALWQKGITIVRDKDQVEFGESLAEFMRGIGESDHLCIFLSDGYLRSPNCMYELYIAKSRSQDNPAEFRSRIKVWKTPNVGDISDLERRAEYVRYWRGESERLKRLVEELGVEGLDPQSLKQYRLTKEFAENVDGLLAFFADTLTPGSFTEFQSWAQSEFHLTGEDESSEENEAKYEKLYDTVVLELNQILNRDDLLCEFVRQTCDDLVVESGDKWALSESVRSREFDDAVPFLESIGEQIKSASLSPIALDLMAEFVGGLVVLTVNRDWVLSQQNLLNAGAVFYPSIHRDNPFVYLPDKGRANFLEIVASALMETSARLTKVFGPLQEIRELIPPLPIKGAAITEADLLHELKRHLVKHVLGQETPIENDKVLERQFSNVRRLIARARKKGNPFIVQDETFRPVIELISRDLELPDLILIFPSGDDHEDSILKDSVIAMTELYEIHESIETLKHSQPPSSS
ncbi:MAG: toll/interleukin-1 receptor domain-containing protein [Verrucomicrobiota bacterium]